ncbi:outer membrane beta-barrel protein [Pedobacter frigoris]|uniref:PorT family protein n=1 Tax=Pedobacter frigoris TaxID=2571272 RepID=A0A4U1CF04_9SPHI|nr:outer membrane beta-barrel protein [Pedobacter frigoris]TKC05023.1 PorT family protein [Pedobacter frigoris]
MKFKSILGILLLYGLYSHAQQPFEKKVKFGIKAGISGSLFTSTVDPFGPIQRNRFNEFRRFLRMSGFGGLTADATVSRRVTVGAEILYNSRGMAYREKNYDVVIIDEDGNEQQAYNDFNYNIDYIEFPLTVNYLFNELSSNVWFAGYAGIAPAVAVNYITKLRYEKSPDGGNRRNYNEKTTLEHVNHFNNSLLAGVKVGENNTGRTSVFADFRTSYTLLPVFNRSSADNGNNLDTRMLTFSIGLGVKF